MEAVNQSISLRTIALRSAALIGSTSIQDGLLSVLFIWLARTDQSGYGLLVFGLSIVMLLRSLQSMGVDQYTLRELSSFQENTRFLLRQMTIVKTLISGGTIFVFLVFAFFIKQWPLYQITLISVLLFSQWFEGIADTFFNLFRAKGQSVNESICRTGPNIISFLYGVGCLYFQLDIFYFSLLFLLNSSLKLVSAIVGARKLYEFSAEQSVHFTLTKNQLISLGLIAAVSFSGTFYNEIQVFWIRHYHSFTDVAIYKVASDITGTICGFVAHLIVGAVLFPQLVKAFAQKSDTQFQNMVQLFFRNIITLGSGVAAFLCIFGGKIAIFIYGDQYLSTEPLMPFFGIAAFFSFINNFLIYVMLTMRNEKRLLLFLTIPVSSSILLGPLLINSPGQTGAVVSLLLSRIFLSIMLVTTLQRKIHFFDLAKYKKVVLYWAGTGTLFMLLLQVNYYLAGSTALLFYFLLIWIEQKTTAISHYKKEYFDTTDK